MTARRVLFVVAAGLGLTACAAPASRVAAPEPAVAAAPAAPPAPVIPDPPRQADQLARIASELVELQNAVAKVMMNTRQHDDQLIYLQRRLAELERQARGRPAAPPGFAPSAGVPAPLPPPPIGPPAAMPPTVMPPAATAPAASAPGTAPAVTAPAATLPPIATVPPAATVRPPASPRAAAPTTPSPPRAPVAARPAAEAPRPLAAPAPPAVPAAPTAPRPPALPALPAAPAPPSASASAAEALYQSGVAKYEAGDRDEAVVTLYEVVVNFPDDPARERAQLLVGEIFIAQKDYRGAVAELESLIAAAPNGSQVPDALLKLGVAHRSLGDEGRARRAWQRLVKEFPASAAARQARTLLKAARG